MRLSDWRAAAPHASSVSDKVLAAVEPVLVGLGCDPDPPCWVVWGDDPSVRYSILALCEAGVASCHVRVNVPQEGPRASGKLGRWNRVQIGELSVETQGGHTMVSFQLEGQLLRAVDDDARAVTAFALDVMAGADGRPFPSLAEEPGAGRRRRATDSTVYAGPPRRRATDQVPALPPPRSAS